jgi:hypothetical protein
MYLLLRNDIIKLFSFFTDKEFTFKIVNISGNTIINGIITANNILNVNSNMINNNVPPVPLKFNEEMDKPINEMEKLISKTIAERTLEIEQITKNNPPPDSSKFIQINDMIPNNINSIQLDDKKHISWNDNNEYYNNNSLEERIMRLEEKMDVIINLLKK